MARYDDWTDEDLLAEVDADGTGLTPWEIEFVESMTKELKAGAVLTAAQRHKLLQLAEERVP